MRGGVVRWATTPSDGLTSDDISRRYRRGSGPCLSDAAGSVDHVGEGTQDLGKTRHHHGQAEIIGSVGP